MNEQNEWRDEETKPSLLSASIRFCNVRELAYIISNLKYLDTHGKWVDSDGSIYWDTKYEAKLFLIEQINLQATALKHPEELVPMHELPELIEAAKVGEQEFLTSPTSILEKTSVPSGEANEWRDEEDRPTKKWLDEAAPRFGTNSYCIRPNDKNWNSYLAKSGLIEVGQPTWWETEEAAQTALDAARQNFEQRERTKKAQTIWKKHPRATIHFPPNPPIKPDAFRRAELPSDPEASEGYEDEEGRPTKEWLDGARVRSVDGVTYVNEKFGDYLDDKGLLAGVAYYWDTEEAAQTALDAARQNFEQRERTAKAQAMRTLDKYGDENFTEGVITGAKLVIDEEHLEKCKTGEPIELTCALDNPKLREATHQEVKNSLSTLAELNAACKIISDAKIKRLQELSKIEDACVGECHIDFAANHVVDVPEGFEPVLARGEKCVDALDPKASAGALKAPLHLIPPVFEEVVAYALASGNPEYGAWNWREEGAEICIMTYIAAIRRHLGAYLDGEDIDPKSGKPHLGHIGASVAILLDAEKYGNLTDNRPNTKKS